MDPARLVSLIESTKRMKTSKYLDVASLTLLVVDYLSTLEMEVKHMWPSPWSPAKVLFFWSRYLVFFDLPFAVYYHTTLGLSPRICKAMFRVGTTSIVAGVLFAEAILFLRVYALSGRNQKLMYFLIFQFIATHVAWIVMYGHFLSSLEFGPSPIPTILGCVPLPPTSSIPNALLAGIFGMILANELSIALMTIVFGLVKYNNLRSSPLMEIFYRDGLVYFVILTGCSIMNLIVDLVGPPEYRFLMVIFQRTVHSLLSCRMVLHMRTYATAGNEITSLSAGHSRIQFARNPKMHIIRQAQTPDSKWDSSAREVGSEGVSSAGYTDESIELSIPDTRFTLSR